MSIPWVPHPGYRCCVCGKASEAMLAEEGKNLGDTGVCHLFICDPTCDLVEVKTLWNALFDMDMFAFYDHVAMGLLGRKLSLSQLREIRESPTWVMGGTLLQICNECRDGTETINEFLTKDQDCISREEALRILD